MALAFVIESLKFWKLRSDRTVHVLFLLAFVFNFLTLAFPVGDNDFSRLMIWLDHITVGALNQTGQAMVPSRSLLTTGNLIFIGFSMLRQIVNLGISLVYTSAMNASFDDYPLTKGIKQFVSRIPALALFALLMIAPFLLSMAALGIPFLVLITTLAFTPMLMIDRRLRLGQALEMSAASTKGIRIQMAMAFFFIGFLINGPKNLIAAMVPANPISTGLIIAFFIAVQTLIVGRLYALFYLYYSRSYPSRRLSNPYSPHDPSTFFEEVNRRGSTEDETADKEDPNDDSLY